MQCSTTKPTCAIRGNAAKRNEPTCRQRQGKWTIHPCNCKVSTAISKSEHSCHLIGDRAFTYPCKPLSDDILTLLMREIGIELASCLLCIQVSKLDRACTYHEYCLFRPRNWCRHSCWYGCREMDARFPELTHRKIKQTAHKHAQSPSKSPGHSNESSARPKRP